MSVPAWTSWSIDCCPNKGTFCYGATVEVTTVTWNNIVQPFLQSGRLNDMTYVCTTVNSILSNAANIHNFTLSGASMLLPRAVAIVATVALAVLL